MDEVKPVTLSDRTRMTLKRLWKNYPARIALGCVLAYVIYAGIALTHMGLNAHRPIAVKKPIEEAIRRRYPELRFEVGAGGEVPNVRVHIFGVKKSATRSEIRDWISSMKSEIAPKLSLWIFWDKEDGSRDPYGEPSKL